MPNLNISKAQSSDMTNRVEDYEVGALMVDSTRNQDETEWINTKFTSQWGYFNAVADLKSAILMKSVWNVGKGWVAGPRDKVILEHVKGWGKDTFDDIIFNMDVMRRVSGDSYAEIIRDKDSGMIINLKPLNPETMKIIVNNKGIIIRYEQINRTDKKGSPVATWKPEEIFHLSNNRLVDQIHGISDIDALEKTLLAEEESFADMKWIAHRQAKPLIMFKIKTDDASKIDAFIRKMDDAVNKGENIYVPDDENTLSWEVVQVSVNNLVMTWRDDIRNKFYRTIGLPQVVPGAGGQSTESESKVIYLAFEQIVEKEQRFLEQQIWNQLQIRINFLPPATLSQELQQDASKDGSNAFQPSDTQAGVGR